jgi:serine/threonine protein kinase
MAAGNRPFPGGTPVDVSSAVLRADPPQLPETSVPAGLRQIIARSLNKRPVDRFQSASDLAFALSSLSALASAPSDTSPRVALPLSRMDRRHAGRGRARCGRSGADRRTERLRG